MQKLKWLRVRLTGWVQKALHRLPEEARASYRALTKALQERFEPKSRMTRYQAEFETRRKKPSEGWADFAEDLRSFADKTFPDLQPEARERLALQTYLKQLEQPQVVFSVSQRCPATLDDVVTPTLEMESYVAPSRPGVQSVSSIPRPDPNIVPAAPPAALVTAAVHAGSSTKELSALMEKLWSAWKHWNNRSRHLL